MANLRHMSERQRERPLYVHVVDVGGTLVGGISISFVGGMSMIVENL